MILQYCSDLHLEFPENNKYMLRNPLKPVGDILLLAGDIVAFTAMNKRAAFFDYIADNFDAAYWVPGNHEYYDADISERSGTFSEKIRDNVFLVNNQVVICENTRLIFSTMWSSISEANHWRVENYISDFKAIRLLDKAFSASAFNELHKECIHFLSDELHKKWMGTTVVITHHVPTFMHYPKKYKGDVLNEVFAVEQTDLIKKTSPEYWIYGHHHANTPGFIIGKTQLLTNQLGYVHHYEHGSFHHDRHIVIDNETYNESDAAQA